MQEVHQLQRSHGEPTDIRKTKAHRSAAKAELDAEDPPFYRAGNAMADDAAKDLAKQLMEQDTTQAEAEGLQDISRRILCRVAFGAAWAHRHWIHDDADGELDEHAPDDHLDADALAEELHVLRKLPKGGEECTICRRMAVGPRALARLRKETCGGSIENVIDESHLIRRSNGIVWCTLCGAFASRWPRRLLTPCARRPKSAAQRNVLRRLMMGMKPTTAGDLEHAQEDAGLPKTSGDDHGEQQWSAGKTVQPQPQSRAQPAQPPAGVYLRLPRRTAAVHPPQAAYSSGGDVGMHVPAAPVQTIVTPPPALSPSSIKAPTPRGAGTTSCPSSSTAHWARRVTAARPPLKCSCSICGSSTLLRCKGCREPLCMSCVKAARECPNLVS